MNFAGQGHSLFLRQGHRTGPCGPVDLGQLGNHGEPLGISRLCVTGAKAELGEASELE